MSLTEQEAADLRDIAMRVRSRHCEEGGDVGAHTVALAVAKLLDENERLKAELGIAEDLVAAGITKRDKLRAELRKLRAELAAANAQLANALNIPMASAADFQAVADESLKLAEEALPAQVEALEVAERELPSQAVVSEAVAHAEESDEDLGDSDTIKLPSLAKVVKTGTTVWEPLRSAEVAVLDKAKELANHVKEYAPALLGTGLHPVRHLIAAVDALIAAESTADGPEQTDEVRPND